jgi:hypothetical protein
MRNAFYLAAVFCAIAPAAFAQSTSNSTTTGQAQAVAIVNGGGDGSGSSGSSHGTETVFSNPALGISSYTSNACGNSTSVGASTPFFGIIGSHNGEMTGCRRQVWMGNLMTAAKMTGDMRFEQTAIGVACLEDDVKKAAPAGFCPGTQAPAAPVATPVALPAAKLPARRPDWCSTWTTADGNVNRYRAICVD